jgi:hypothetical protein
MDPLRQRVAADRASRSFGYTPATNLGHMLAVIEALLGQIYLVTVVALLVARLRIRPRESQ